MFSDPDLAGGLIAALAVGQQDAVVARVAPLGLLVVEVGVAGGDLGPDPVVADGLVAVDAPLGLGLRDGQEGYRDAEVVSGHDGDVPQAEVARDLGRAPRRAAPDRVGGQAPLALPGRVDAGHAELVLAVLLQSGDLFVESRKLSWAISIQEIRGIF